MTQERRGGNPGAQISGEPIEGQCTEIRSDMGSYSIVPEWVLDRASPRAVKLYAILGRYADDSTSESWPKRRRATRWLS